MKGRMYRPAAVAAMIAVAIGLRYIDIPFAGVIRPAIYVTLYILWGISVTRRTLHPQIRRMFGAVAVLMVFWMTARTVKYLLPDTHPVGRYCWYLYYLPMLVIPLLMILIAALLGRPESCRLPRWRGALYAAAAALVALVLTNDLHQWVFAFPTDFAHYVDGTYRYGPGFIPIAVWRYGGVLITLALVFLRSRLPNRGRRILAPVVPALLLVLYHIIYLSEAPWLRAVFGDLTATECLLVICIVESCMRTGLIPSNSRYGEIFSAADLSAQIVDGDYRVCYTSHGAVPLSRDLMERAEEGPVMVDEGRQLQSMPVPGGHVLWTADISPLLELQRELREIHEELVEGNDALRHEYEEEQKYRRIMEQNRLYDVLQTQTQSQINDIYALAGAYRRAEDGLEKRAILSRIILLGSFVKRRKDFVLSMDVSPLLPDRKLRSALGESYRALALMGVGGTYQVDTGREVVPGGVLTAAYDFFETFVEAALPTLRTVNVTLRPVEGRLRVRILADCAGELSALGGMWPEAAVEADEDGVCAVLALEGGDAP